MKFHFTYVILFVSVCIFAQRKPPQASIKLDTVSLQTSSRNVDSIMKRVRFHLDKNHQLQASQLKFTMTKTTVVDPDYIRIKMVKGEKRDQKKIDAKNSELSNFCKLLQLKPPKVQKAYSGNLDIQDKNIQNVFLKTAYEYHSFKNFTYLDSIPELLGEIMRSEFDKNSIYKMKSGWLPVSQKIQWGDDQPEIHNKKGTKSKTKEFDNKSLPISIGSQINRFTNGMNNNTSLIDFILEPKNYKYKLVGNGKTDTYQIIFYPRNKKAKYEGILNINPSDYGIIEFKYNYAPKVNGSKTNLKFVLGLKSEETKNQVIYKFKKDAIGYYPSYIHISDESEIYVHRPLQFKDKTNREHKKFDIAVESRIQSCTTIEILDRNSIRDTDKKYNFTGISKTILKRENE